jgi:tRNA(Ile)-lysidine synthase TilS/MesJ
MELLEKFTAFIAEKHLFSKQERILIALSGGLDSVVLLHLIKNVRV